MCYYLPSAWPQGIPTPALEHNRSSHPALQILHLNFNQIVGISEKLALIFQPKVNRKVQTEMLSSLWESLSHQKSRKVTIIYPEIYKVIMESC